MSKQQDSDSINNIEGLAFEFVTGTLRGSERASFKQKMRSQTEVAAVVSFWEERLMAQQATTIERIPRTDTWNKIAARISPEISEEKSSKKSSFFDLFRWQRAVMTFTFLWAVSVTLWFGYERSQGQEFVPNSDYVAVLTDTENRKPLLTALTATEGKTLWLKWEGADKDFQQANSSIQLWAQSRRDGQIRPLHVFDRTGVAEIELDEATLRLIKDSEYLLLTREEEGGSAIGEPSEAILARGLCVRLNANTI
ncbi:MAG: anti-sigma factor [Cellvibrionaceae bacterium]|nr:anti-sigma factor [Cellvibrionaceae bacterium]